MPAAQGVPKTVIRRMRPFWHLLVDPLDTVLDPAQRRQARLLNYLLVPVFASLAFLMLWGGRSSGILFLAVDFFVLLIIYMLNRIGWYGAAALALSLLISAAALTNVLMQATIGSTLTPNGTLMWITPAIVIAYLLLPLRTTMLLVAANLIAILIVPQVSNLTYNNLLPTFYLTVVISLLMLIAAVWRDRYLSRLERQSRELRESEARFRILLEATFETIAIHKDGTILDINPAVEALLGYKPEEIIGRKTIEFVDPVSYPVIEAIARQDSQEPYEAVLRHKNGTALHAELRGKTQWYQGELVRVIAVRDITELKHEEELIVEQEKVRVLQKFIGDLSHDLRTPLSVINTSIYLIGKLAQEPDRQRHQIDVLQGQATHMQRLLEDLISMARLDKADTSDFKFRRANINEPVAQAVRDQQNLALRKRQMLSYELAAELPEVQLDAENFRLAIKHLILNGLGYTKTGGSVIVETLEDGTSVIVQVRDNGVGIEPDDMPHIFEQFYRADPARGDEGGTGVGLTIAKKIVEAHKGKIEVESKPGQGSVFRILLPKSPQ